MITKIKATYREDVLEILQEVNDDATEEKLMAWEQEEWYDDVEMSHVDYCPECGNPQYVKGCACTNCGFNPTHPQQDFDDLWISDFWD